MAATEIMHTDRGWRRLVRNWNWFWFTPRDPLLLGVMRILTGAVFCYSLVIYSFSLSDFLGPHAWFDLEAAQEAVMDQPKQAPSFTGRDNVPCAPTTIEEEQYRKDYADKFGVDPPCPFPRTKKEENYCERFRMQYGFDLRAYGLPPPQNDEQFDQVRAYADKWKLPMPPPYPKNQQEADEIDRYAKRWDVDPRRIYARGACACSIWFHVADPFWMGVTHALFITAAVLFTLGIGTRVTSLLTWFAAVNYIQRDTLVAYGVDTMMTILLLYLAIGPSGGALSLDRWLARWRRGRGAAPAPTQPALSANVALRLLQIHVCIIYAMAGLSKLQGNAWWDGTALWNVLGNFELAPMQFRLYHWLLHFLGDNQLYYELFLTGGVYFTLAFELLYPVWIWRPSTRWLILASAILLHGVIGTLMGLGTFALIMLIMNMAFLRDGEVAWMLALFGIEMPKAKA